ncbi:Hypothetical predicted protein [Octopus vulgaris]|uniref:Uncharacterized protein n=1 Tax=Octopus vulgaris TaxID=6645 RepID=A0AA36AHD6_OCTVU|nr:Hypothetical predicted protein [Octopus vulgaris]
MDRYIKSTQASRPMMAATRVFVKVKMWLPVHWLVALALKSATTTAECTMLMIHFLLMTIAIRATAKHQKEWLVHIETVCLPITSHHQIEIEKNEMIKCLHINLQKKQTA